MSTRERVGVERSWGRKMVRVGVEVEAVTETAPCWSYIPISSTSPPGHIPTGQITLRPRRKSSTNLQPPLLLLQNLITLLPAPGPWASVALVPCTRLHTPGTSFPSYVTSTALDWVADAEIRPRRGKPPKPGSYTAWFPRQPSHSRQTVQRGAGRWGGGQLPFKA